MKVVLQRVKTAQVGIEGRVVASINRGLLLFLGVSEQDNEKEAILLANKVFNLRIFEDANDKMNLSIKDVQGEILVVSQFTLYGDCSHGRRPSFIHAANPVLAEKLYLYFVTELQKNITVKTGVFRACMDVSLINDGPVTFVISSEELSHT
jgi:D-tyrosyl-tRNA(Tyr) deacylase